MNTEAADVRHARGQRRGASKPDRLRRCLRHKIEHPRADREARVELACSYYLSASKPLSTLNVFALKVFAIMLACGSYYQQSVVQTGSYGAQA